MKKEVFLAISIGFILGLVITFGIWTANKSLKNLPQASGPTPTSISATSSPDSPTSTPPPDLSAPKLPLSITAPADESLVTRSALTLSGKTTAGAAVSITFEKGEQVVEADTTGSFTTDITLEGGYNLITVTALDKTGNSTTQKLTVTFTTAAI